MRERAGIQNLNLNETAKIHEREPNAIEMNDTYQETKDPMGLRHAQMDKENVLRIYMIKNENNVFPPADQGLAGDLARRAVAGRHCVGGAG